ncbi:MAG: hypothetical protein AB1742_12555 [bacterium]
MKKTAFVIAAFIAACLAAPAARAAEVRNLSLENRTFLREKVGELRLTELWKVSRGRLRPNPIPLSLFTAYQTLITSGDFLLSRHDETFASSLARLRDPQGNGSKRPDDSEAETVLRVLENELVDAYLLKNALAEAGTMLEVREGMNRAALRMQSVPVRAGLALSAWKWIRAFHGAGGVPDGVKSRWMSLVEYDFAASDAAELNEAVGRVSAEYSRLMLDVVTGGVK